MTAALRDNSVPWGYRPAGWKGRQQPPNQGKVRTPVAYCKSDSRIAERKTVKLIRSIIGAVTGGNDTEKPWEFAPLQVDKPITLDERRAAEQAKQIKLGYSVEIINKGEGVRYTEGLRIVEAKIGWDDGARLVLNTMSRWVKPEPRELTTTEFIRILTRIGEYLTCDGKPLTVVDQAPPLRVEDATAASTVLPRVACWTRLERDFKIVEERQPAAAQPASGTVAGS
jgi:hypothetical protein